MSCPQFNICCTTEDIDRTLASLQAPPHLIITDSQVFDIVEKKKPAKSLLTSFSVLMAAHKGDINYFVHSAAAIDHLTEKSRILIAEACTHAPLAEDIGREKIPRMLRQRVGQGLTIDIVAGKDFPADLSPYDLIIHCRAIRRRVFSARGFPLSKMLCVGMLQSMHSAAVW